MLIVDRIIEDFAVCEDAITEKFVDISLSELPDNVKEGDCIILIDDRYVIDEEVTNRRREENFDLYNQLFNNE